MWIICHPTIHLKYQALIALKMKVDDLELSNVVEIGAKSIYKLRHIVYEIINK